VRETEVRVLTLNPDGSLRHHSTDNRAVKSSIDTASASFTVTSSIQSRQSPNRQLVVRELNVEKGQLVTAGQPLCVLADYGQLHLEGRAFEQDVDDIKRAAEKGWPVTAIRETRGNNRETIEGLKIVHLDNEIDLVSRAFHFNVRLSNEIVRRSTIPEGNRFVDWRFRPGQRMQMRVTVEEWPDRIVLPIDAVAQEGVEFYVFQQNGDHFDRRPVHVEYQDQSWVVIANDGSLFPGDVVAFAGAHQMQMELKNKASGGGGGHGHMH
jgi:multidrug efflux pump subunit AcrA (membrane-fusion protein)